MVKSILQSNSRPYGLLFFLGQSFYADDNKYEWFIQRRRNYSEQMFRTAQLYLQAKNIYELTNTHTLTKSVITQIPAGRWFCMCFSGMCVYVCVGSAVPPECPETNWQLETLWLQGKVSGVRDGDKEEGERESKREQERERKERQQDTTTRTKGGQAQQSVANSHFTFVMLTVPSSYPLCKGGKPKGEGEKVFTLTRTFRRTPFCVPSPPSRTFLNNTLERRTILLLTPPPDSVSIQGSCEQGLKPLLTILNSPLCSLCNYFAFKSIIRAKTVVKRQALHGHDFLQQACANSTDLPPVGAHTHT